MGGNFPKKHLVPFEVSNFPRETSKLNCKNCRRVNKFKQILKKVGYKPEIQNIDDKTAEKTADLITDYRFFFTTHLFTMKVFERNDYRRQSKSETMNQR